MQDEQHIIGLTGMYCAGKNHIARLLEARSLAVLDVDKLGHQAIELERGGILERFGPSILGEDGIIDRRLLGAKVFGNAEALACLENLVHPAANQLTEAWITAQGGKPCVINAALLHRSAAFSSLEGIILVKAPVLTRLLRARKRDRLPWGTLITRFRSQKDFTSKYFKKGADIYIIHNRGWGYTSLWSPFIKGSLENRIDEILEQLLWKRRNYC
ncbi:MAG: dephospho-CoA kinase [Treponema sp.]|jgi:dephospho-CoA kinase|nr:dephospho-CoA kinase [Treponema sp.]